MSQLDASTASLPYAAGDIAATLEAPRRVRGLIHQAVIDTFSGWRAKAGTAWIAVIVFAGFYAPFLANSYPYWARVDGRSHYPLFSHLGPVDVALALLPLLIGLVFYVLRGRRLRLRLLVTLVGGAVLTTISYLTVKPPGTEQFNEYRVYAQTPGLVTAALYPPIPYSPGDRLLDQPQLRLTPPSSKHWFGVDPNGSDLLSRLLHACRIAMAIGLVSTSIAVLIGVVIGGVMGYFSGTVDIIGMRLIEIFEAIPTLFLLITIVAFFGRNLYMVMAVIGLVSWTGDARFIRAEFLRLRNQDYVQAATAAGLPLWSILFRHMLPNGVSPVIVSASFGVASAILAEATLSFLGLGLVEEPSWGQSLNQALGVGGGFIWWIAIFPGAAIFLTVFAYNLIGESLRDALDPRLHGIE